MGRSPKKVPVFADEFEGDELDDEPANDGPTVELDPEYALCLEPHAQDVQMIDRAFQKLDRSVAPGAPRPGSLLGRPSTKNLGYALQVMHVANEVESEGLLSTVSIYVLILYAVMRLRVSYGPDAVVLDALGELAEWGYLVVITRDGNDVRFEVRLRETGLKEPLDVRMMQRQGFPKRWIACSQAIHETTPQHLLHAMKRAANSNN